MTDYYIIAGVVYQAPDLGTLLNARKKTHHAYVTNEHKYMFLSSEAGSICPRHFTPIHKVDLVKTLLPRYIIWPRKIAFVWVR